jgi:signal transduction histidine kinase
MSEAVSETRDSVSVQPSAASAAGAPAVRLFGPLLNVVWDSLDDREARFPLYLDHEGRPVPLPVEGPERDAWPVQIALNKGKPATKDYALPKERFGGPRVCRINARPAVLADGSRLVVEETSLLVPDESPIGVLESQLTDLMRRLAEFFAREHDPVHLDVRLRNENLRPCHEIKNCRQSACPAYETGDDRRCWEINHTHCPSGMDPRNLLDKLQYCEQCDVYLFNCPDALTRVGERINQLLHLLSAKYQEAESARHQLQQAEKMAAIGELTLGIAHEVKNPLSVILGRLDCLNLEIETLTLDELDEDLGVIRNHAIRMRDALEDLMNLARPRNRERKSADLREVALKTLSMMRKTLDKANIRLALDLEENLPSIMGDPLQIQQALLNLILNAKDAMPAGGTLTIQLKRAALPAAGVSLAVKDTGRGIPRKDLARVFSPFFSTRFGEGGTGLGLAVTQRIMEQHGGGIDVESRLKKGTAFTLRFPCEREA